MPQIKYVGAKPEETAFFHDTNGIVWTPGSSHHIADQRLAARMLQHPDVFARDEGDPQAIGLSGSESGLDPSQSNAVQVVMPRTEPTSMVTSTDDGPGPDGGTDGKAATGTAEADNAVVETEAGDADVDGLSLAPGAEVTPAASKTVSRSKKGQ